MYWRVQKYSPKDFVKHYGIHIGLIISLFLNFVLIITRPGPPKEVSNQVKTDFDQFARRVTQHILDTSYISYESSVMSLIRQEDGELTPPVTDALQRNRQLPSSTAELKATLKMYTDQRRISATRIDEVAVSDRDSQGMIPIDVVGITAVHSADESTTAPYRFHFHFLVGFRPNSQTPVVAGFQDISPSPG